ncbi:MAG: GtrA family protein [Bacteroidales bacterium]|jgi:putative flippase GtrA|nr:GtrA family protein [Bacteroidales bacterium]
MLEQFIIFSLVGFSGLILDFGLTWILKELLRVNRYISNSIGFMTAASSNYILNRLWTFESSNPQIAQEYFTFLIISIAGLVINSLILYLLTDRLIIKQFPDDSKIKFYMAKLVATAVVTIWNFFMNFFITFS